MIDRFWFDPEFWDEGGVGTYSTMGGANVLLALHLTVFHVVVSICMPIIITEWFFPSRRNESWVGSRGMFGAVIAIAVVVPIFSLQFRFPGYLALVVAGILFVIALVAAFSAPRSDPLARVRDGARRRGVAWVAFAATASQFTLTYWVPSLPLPWPLGVGLALLPVPLAWIAIKRLGASGYLGRDGIRVMSGVAAFFVPLGAVIGLSGRFDLTIGAVLTGLLLWRINRAQKCREAASTPT